MGLFSRPKVVILKESSNAVEYLQQLERLRTKVSGEAAKQIDKEIMITKAGIAGENNILFELENSGMDMVVLHDLYFESPSGTSAQIDFLVITPKINFVIECKNLFGNIEITNKGDFIRTTEYGGKRYKEGIYSPVTQNQRHLQVIKECRLDNQEGLMRLLKSYGFESFFKGLVVLANPKTIVNDRWAKKEIKNQVIRADQLIETIKRMNKESKEFSNSPREMLECGKRYLTMSKEAPTDYMEKFKDLIQQPKEQPLSEKEENSLESTSVEEQENTYQQIDNKVLEADQKQENDTPEEKICPRCGKILVMREAKRGNYVGEKFYGCSGYPKCRYIEKCPE